MLELRKGGKLFRGRRAVGTSAVSAWKNVTRFAAFYRFERCVLARDVTLRDVFLLLRANGLLLAIAVGGARDAEAFLDEALSGPGVPYSRKYDPDGIEYLELSKWLSFDRGLHPMALDHVEFHGLGFALRKRHEDGWRKGTRIPFCIAGSRLATLVNLPLKLGDDYRVVDATLPSGRGDQRFRGAQFTLGSILRGVMWELSYYGSPSRRDRFVASLRATVAEVTAGAATVPFRRKRRATKPPRSH